MANLLENADTIRQQARLFDDVRPAGVKCFLLKRAGQTERFNVVREVVAGWFASFDKQFREELKVSIATEAADFGDVTAQSSYLAYGSISPFDVYKFKKKDVVQPNATSPSWKIFATRDGTERFEIL